MKLSVWAKKNNISYQTAWRHFKTGLIPNARQLPTGTVVIDEVATTSITQPNIVLYARVSSSQNKDKLDSQMLRLRLYAAAKGYIVAQEIKEIGSGLNDKRGKLCQLLNNKEVTKIIVEHKDRLTRFGFNYLHILLTRLDCEIEIINQVETDKEDIILDLVSIITSFCARIYGQRQCKRKTEAIIQDLNLNQ